jgi:hypothetical protein
MWQLGGFAGQTVNETLLTDPWSQTGRANTPFDQPFYLILDVAVGSTNGWFPDGVGNKPWTDGGNAAADFYRSKSICSLSWLVRVVYFRYFFLSPFTPHDIFFVIFSEKVKTVVDPSSADHGSSSRS